MMAFIELWGPGLRDGIVLANVLPAKISYRRGMEANRTMCKLGLVR